MIRLIKRFFIFCKWFCLLWIWCIFLFLSLCMNVFTIPIFLIAYLFCVVTTQDKPYFGRKGLMVYPSWAYPKASAKIQILNFVKLLVIACMVFALIILLVESQWVWFIVMLIATIFIAGLFSDKDTTIPGNKAMTGLPFEQFCADLLTRQGYKRVVVTPGSGDFGADVIAYDNTGAKWVFQCKFYSGKVNNSAVQEIVAAKAHYGANKAGVMTNSRLTEQARQLALENEIILFEGLCD